MRLALVCVAVVLASPCVAADFPKFDVEAGCRRAHGQNVAYSACIELEQTRYDYSKVMFDTLTERQQTDCIRRLDSIKQYQYSMLSGCIASFAEQNRVEDVKRLPSRFRY